MLEARHKSDMKAEDVTLASLIFDHNRKLEI